MKEFQSQEQLFAVYDGLIDAIVSTKMSHGSKVRMAALIGFIQILDRSTIEYRLPPPFALGFLYKNYYVDNTSTPEKIESFISRPRRNISELQTEIADRGLEIDFISVVAGAVAHSFTWYNQSDALNLDSLIRDSRDFFTYKDYQPKFLKKAATLPELKTLADAVKLVVKSLKNDVDESTEAFTSRIDSYYDEAQQSSNRMGFSR